MVYKLFTGTPKKQKLDVWKIGDYQYRKKITVYNIMMLLKVTKLNSQICQLLVKKSAIEYKKQVRYSSKVTLMISNIQRIESLLAPTTKGKIHIKVKRKKSKKKN